MWQWKKSDACRIVLVALGLPLRLAQAEILINQDRISLNIVDYSRSPPRSLVLQSPRSMPSILIVPGAMPLQSPSAYLAWRHATANVVGVPVAGATGTGFATRLQNQRNIARSQAYRSEYFRK